MTQNGSLNIAYRFRKLKDCLGIRTGWRYFTQSVLLIPASAARRSVKRD
jgi:hypothetical protein